MEEGRKRAGKEWRRTVKKRETKRKNRRWKRGKGIKINVRRRPRGRKKIKKAT